MSLARVTLEEPPSAKGVRNEPLATGGDPLPQLGVAHGKAVEKETVGTNHHLRRDGNYSSVTSLYLCTRFRFILLSTAMTWSMYLLTAFSLRPLSLITVSITLA